MISIESLYDEWSYELPLCAPDRFEADCRYVARDLCTRTKRWEADLDSITANGTATHDLDSPESQSEVFGINKITVASNLIYDDTARRELSQVRAKYGEGQPPFTIAADLTEFSLIEQEIPTAGQVIEVRGYLRPTRTATSLPNLFNDHDMLEALRCGTLSKLMLVPGMGWSNAEAGAYHSAKYESSLLGLATISRQGNTRTALRVRKWG